MEEKDLYVRQMEEQMKMFSDDFIDPEEFDDALAEIESHNKAIKGLTSKYNILEREKREVESKYQALLKQREK